jgi:hypothetical protein
MEKAPLAAAPLLRSDWDIVASYFAESFNRNLGKFAGRYVDKMDAIWTEIWLSKRSLGSLRGQEGP